MPVAKFLCPECNRVINSAKPLPEGKRVKCPKCAAVITVPAPAVELDEAVDQVEAEPETRVSSRRAKATARPVARDDDDDERPARKRSRRDEDEDEEEKPRTKGKPKRKARQGMGGVGLALVLGGAFLGLAALSVGGYFVVTVLFTSRIQQRAQVLDEATALLTPVKDQASVEAAKPALLRVAARLKAFQDQDEAAAGKGTKADPEAFQRAMDEAMRNPDKARARAEQMAREAAPFNEAARKLTAEAIRVQKVPGGKELVQAFFDAWGTGSAPVSIPVNIQAKLGDMFKATRENYDKVQVGWTEQQVTDLLGTPPFTHAKGPNAKTFQYPFGMIDITDGRVTKK